MQSSTLFQALLLGTITIFGCNAAVVERGAPRAYCPRSNPVVNSLKGSAAATSFCGWYHPAFKQTNTIYKTIDLPQVSTLLVTTKKGTAFVTLPAVTKTIVAPATITTSSTTTAMSTDVVGATIVQTSTYTEIRTATTSATVTICIAGPAKRSAPRNVPDCLEKLFDLELKNACSCLRIPAKTTTIIVTRTAKCSRTVTSRVTAKSTVTVQPTTTSFTTPTSLVTIIHTNRFTQTATSTTQTVVTSTSTTVTTLTSTGTISPPQATNLIANGDFQTGDLTFWSPNSGSVSVAAELNDASNFVAVLSQACPPESNAVLAQFYRGTVSGQETTISYDYTYVSNSGTRGGCVLQVQNDQSEVVTHEFNETTLGQKQNVVRTFTATTDVAYLYFRVQCYLYNSEAATEWDAGVVNVDNVSIVGSQGVCPADSGDSQ